ncbi:MAG: hypothetical protein KA004_15600 [Verrucomicrobiales bacterium]|nr:hypothetical protein [Verrucomicrobiales bacterium]
MLLRFLLFSAILAAPVPAGVSQFWFYRPTNLLVEEQTTATVQLIERAGRAGYTHCLIADAKFSRLQEMPERYFKNAARVKQAAQTAGVALIPALFSIGYSNDLLHSDPNLVESLPARETPLVIRNGGAVVEQDPEAAVKGGDFSNGMKGWAWKDDNVTIEDGIAIGRNPNGTNCRISQKVKLHPWRQYHLSVRIRTRDFRGTPTIRFLAGNIALNHDELHIPPTQDWKEHHVVFNSQGFREANLYLGSWDGTTGEVAWDDARLEEVAFINLVRRESCPLELKSQDGRILREEVDFENLTDPLMGTRPYAGCFTVYHQPPVLKTKLPDGTRLRVSYYHAVTVLDDQANICVSEPKTWDILNDQAKRLHALWNAGGYLMSFDEIRVFNHCGACEKRALDAGPMLADAARRCAQILRRINPKGRIYIWSDMFDPNHNAHADYYLTKGDYRGSWEGLDRDVIIVPWYFEKRRESLAFFANRGHRQIMAGYYDGPPEPNAAGWMEAAAKTKGVDGIIYTTWRNDYSQLETFIQAAKKH